MSRDLTALLDHPNVRRYLDAIAQAEGTAQHADPYRVGYGGHPIADLARHPGTARRFQQTDGQHNVTTAAGKYQFLRGTWNDVARTLGLTDFSPRSQDLGALELMRRSGSLDDVLRGDFANAVRKDGRTWASLPSSPYPQPKRSSAYMTQALAGASTATPPPPYAPLPATAPSPRVAPHYRPALPPILPAPTPIEPVSRAVYPPLARSPSIPPPPLAALPEMPYSLDLDLQQLRRTPSSF